MIVFMEPELSIMRSTFGGTWAEKMSSSPALAGRTTVDTSAAHAKSVQTVR
jgi:hypothetical protein